MSEVPSMSLHRMAASRDINEPEIVEALRKAGAYVYVMREPVDLLVAFRGETFLIEVKMPKTGRVTPAQSKFFEEWPIENAHIVKTIEEALSAVGVTE